MINVTQSEGDKPERFVVEVRNGGMVTEHWVTLDDNTHIRLADGVGREQIIAAAFRFLLDREPAGAILTEFDITTISSFFPEFEAELPNYLDDTN